MIRFKVVCIFIFACNLGGDLISQPNELKLITDIDTTEVLQNQCFTQRILLAVDTVYKGQAKFTEDYQMELNELLTSVTSKKALYHRTTLADLKPTDLRKVGENLHYVYLLHETAICPVDEGQFKIPSFSITVEEASGATYILKSQEETIKVWPIPKLITDSIYTNMIYKMTGEFVFRNLNKPPEACYVNDTIDYSFRISGKGVSNMIKLPINSSEGLKILSSEKSSDTIRYGSLRAQKIFRCKLIFTRSGSYDLSEVFKWKYYSSKDDKIKVLSSKEHISVNGPEGIISTTDSGPKKQISTVIALDVSKSMLIEDYKPNRLKTIEKSLLEFLDNLSIKPEFVFFAGAAKKADFSELSAAIELPKGTAIGDAIVEAIDILKQSSNTKKEIIVIGDGDNTAGFIHPEVASSLATQYGITIHSIGIGSTGLVPFGVDKFGRQRLVDNSYQSTTLKKIAMSTGGSFYEYKDDGTFQMAMNKLLDFN